MAIRFLWDNKFDTGTLTASTEATNFPKENVRHRWWQKHWRPTSAENPSWLKNNKGSAVAATVCAIRYNNFTGSATVKIQGNASDSWGSPSFDQAFGTISTSLMIQYFSASQSYQWWRHTIADTGNPDSLYKEGRLYLGEYFTPGRNFSLGGGHKGYVVRSTRIVGEQGHITAIKKTRAKYFEYIFERISASDKAIFESMFAAHEDYGGFFFTEDSANPTTTSYYVNFMDIPRFQPEFNSLWTVTIRLVEAM